MVLADSRTPGMIPDEFIIQLRATQLTGHLSTLEQTLYDIKIGNGLAPHQNGSALSICHVALDPGRSKLQREFVPVDCTQFAACVMAGA